MQHLALNGQIREVGNKATIKAFRRQGLVPCNLYGAGMENILFTVGEKELKTVTDTPNAYIVDLNLDGKVYKATIHETQWHPVSDICLHADFLAVNPEKPVAIEVPIVITGHAIGVQQGGKFVQKARKIKISALENKLPDYVTIDISGLGIEKRIKAGEVKVENVTVLSDKDMIICGVKATRNASAAE